jgi:DDE_Tnp_1-associated
VANQRLCVLPAGRRPHLASAVLGACLQRVGADYAERFGHPVLAVETFTDPARHTGACYAAAGFTPLGLTAGYARNRGTKIAHGVPKTYWFKPLHPRAGALLAADFDVTVVALRTPGGRSRMSVSRPDLNLLDLASADGGLLAALAGVIDHRKNRGKRHGLAAILAVAVCAVLAGADGRAQIAQYAQMLPQPALTRLGIRRNKRLGRCVPPSYSTIRRAFARVDPDAFDRCVSLWLYRQVTAGNLSATQLRHLIIALDGKTVRGATKAGEPLHLFAAITHDTGTVLAQTAVPSKKGEGTQLSPVLDQIAELRAAEHTPTHREPTDQNNDDTHNDEPGESGPQPPDRDRHDSPQHDGHSHRSAGHRRPGTLAKVLLTADALHTTKASAQRITDDGGNFILIVKGNHCAARRLVVYPTQLGGIEERSLGPMAHLEPKGKGNSSMPGNRRSGPGVWDDAPGDPCDMAKARLPEPQSSADALYIHRKDACNRCPSCVVRVGSATHSSRRGAMPSEGI